MSFSLVKFQFIELPLLIFLISFSNEILSMNQELIQIKNNLK